MAKCKNRFYTAFSESTFLFLSNFGQVSLSINSLKGRIYAIFIIYVIGQSLFWVLQQVLNLLNFQYIWNETKIYF